MSWDANKVIVIATVLLLALLSWWLPSFLGRPVASLASAPRSDPDYYVENFTSTTMDKDGEPKYVLAARKLTHFPDDTAQLEQPRLSQYSKGAAPTHTTADSGRVYNDGKEIIMLGHVRVSRGLQDGAPGGDVTTPELHVVLE
jgi:lipopolysaccharide export system protein LptC